MYILDKNILNINKKDKNKNNVIDALCQIKLNANFVNKS